MTAPANTSTGSALAPLILALEGEVLPSGLRGEKIALKLQAAASLFTNRLPLDVTVLPYNPQAVDSARNAKNAGRTVILSANPNDPITSQIATHLEVFDRVEAIPASPRASIPKPIFAQVKAWAKALRVHQWVKNALIFVPLLASHQIDRSELLIEAILAFLAFGLCASSVYVLNDLLDLTDDRHHKSKRFRPFASGTLSIQSGLWAFPALLLLSFAIALSTLPLLFSAVLGVYYLLTLMYSMILKRVMALDVIALAMLYTLRIFAGVAALSLNLTFWLLAFATFLFLSLALAKRFAEVKDALERGRTGKTRGRDYEPGDLDMISSLGAASGYQAVMVLALYIHEQSTIALYERPELLWLACPVLLFWITRVWMIAHRGQMHEDPVVFAARDWVSQVAGAVFLLVFLFAS